MNYFPRWNELTLYGATLVNIKVADFDLAGEVVGHNTFSSDAMPLGLEVSWEIQHPGLWGSARKTCSWDTRLQQGLRSHTELYISL